MRPIDILTGEIAIEVTGVVGVSPALWYFRYLASIFLTTQAPVSEIEMSSDLMCGLSMTAGRGHTKKRPGTGNNARRIGILFKSNFCRNYNGI